MGKQSTCSKQGASTLVAVSWVGHCTVECAGYTLLTNEGTRPVHYGVSLIGDYMYTTR